MHSYSDAYAIRILRNIIPAVSHPYPRPPFPSLPSSSRS
jgi:hypothetical protein